MSLRHLLTAHPLIVAAPFQHFLNSIEVHKTRCAGTWSLNWLAPHTMHAKVCHEHMLWALPPRADVHERASRAGCYIPMSPLVPLSGIFWFRRMQERSKYLLHRDGCFQLQISDAHQARFSTNCAVINGNLQTNHHYNSHPPLSNQPFFYRMPFLRSRFSSFCFSGYRLPKLSWVCASSPLNEMPRTSSKPAGISPHRVGSFPPS